MMTHGLDLVAIGRRSPCIRLSKPDIVAGVSMSSYITVCKTKPCRSDLLQGRCRIEGADSYFLSPI